MPKAPGSSVCHLNWRLQNPSREDLRLRSVLDQLHLQREAPCNFFVPTAYSSDQFRLWHYEGQVIDNPRGCWQLVAAQVSLPLGGIGLIQFTGKWAARNIPFRNPNPRQKYQHSKLVEYCQDQGIPILLLERHMEEAAFYLFTKRWLLRIKQGDVSPYEPKQRKDHAKTMGGHFKWERIEE